MPEHRIKLSILLIVLLACLVIFILNLADGASVKYSPTIEVTPSNTQPQDSKDKTEEITNTPIEASNTKAMLEGSGIQNAQLVVMHRPDWKFGENLIDQLEQLKNAAAGGDNEASYILSMNLRYCFHAPVDGTALEKKLEQAYEYSDSERAVSRIIEKYEYCSGIVEKQRNQFYSYSAAAASNGYVAAQEIIGTVTPEFFMEYQGYKDLEREEYIQMRDNFIAQKINFLEQAAKNGSIRALARLSSMNRSQNFGDNGYVKSFGMNQLILELTPDNKIYNRYSRIQQKLQSKLTSEEVDSAFAMYEKWLETIKTNGTLYLNRN